MSIEKDIKDLYISKGNLPASYVNGLASLIENGGTDKVINLPQDYGGNNFPNHSREELVKGSLITLSGDYSLNNNILSLNNGKYARFYIYPNVEPFNKWEEFKIRTGGQGNSLTLQIINTTNEVVYEETKTSSGSSDEGYFISWDLTKIGIGLEELFFKIISNANNINILKVSFGYDLTPKESDNLFNNINQNLSSLNQGMENILDSLAATVTTHIVPAQEQFGEEDITYTKVNFSLLKINFYTIGIQLPGSGGTVQYKTWDLNTFFRTALVSPIASWAQILNNTPGAMVIPTVYNNSRKLTASMRQPAEISGVACRIFVLEKY